MPEETEGSSPGSKAPQAADDTGFRPSYVFLGVVTLVNLVADLWSKDWAKTHFETALPGEAKKMVVIDHFMNFIFAKNRGGAWGLLQNENEALRRPFFLVVSVAAIVFIVSLYRKLQPGQTALKWGLPLVLGGALGNLVDRIRYGYVVDFIDMYMMMDGDEKHWPTFNVADIAICVGVGLMAIDMFTSRDRKAKAPADSDDKPSSERGSERGPESESPKSEVDPPPESSEEGAEPAPKDVERSDAASTALSQKG